MSEFERTDTSSDLFEGTDEIVKIVLKFNDNYVDRDKNTDNTLTIERIRQYLSSEQRTCFFQNQKPYEKKNDSGNTKTNSIHKIIIPIGNKRAIELNVRLWSDEIDSFTRLHSYYVIKSKEIPFFKEPIKDTLRQLCSFCIATRNEKIGTNDISFTELYKKVDSQNIPTIDINKEKDKKIWKKYVEALKKIVKKKEQVWKIQKVDGHKVNKDNSEPKYLMDIYIDKKDLIKQFEYKIKNYFNDSELGDYGVTEDKAFIEFNSYIVLSEEEKNKIKELATEYFYDISKDSPIHSVSGEFTFKYANDTTYKNEILDQLTNTLSKEYHIKINIDNYIDNKGYLLDISENDSPHIQKVIKDNQFASMLELKQDNRVSLKVQIEKRKITSQLVNQIELKLKEKGLNLAKVSRADENNLLVEIGSFLEDDIFNGDGLFLKKTITRFSTNAKNPLKEINGFEIVGNIYQATNIKNYQGKKLFNEIRNKDSSFKWLPTQYYFGLSQEKDIDKFRDFKTKIDEKGKTTFDIDKSILTINAKNSSEYEDYIDRIKSLCPNVILENKTYKPGFYLQFKTDLENQRQSIIGKIRNEIGRRQTDKVEYNVLKNYTEIRFEYSFKTEEERDNFKQIISDVCTPYSDLLNYTFDDNLGKTTYEFIKNKKIELEKEKEIESNIRNATFIYLTHEEIEKLIQAIESEDDDSFRGGKEIGKLIQKYPEKLRFHLTESFYNSINAKEGERLTLDEIKKGYIKPIFRGDLVNIDRMLRAMEKVINPGKLITKKGTLHNIGFPANRNLPDFLFDPSTAELIAEDIEEKKKQIVSNLNEPLLENQPKQLEAVAKSLLAKDIALIQGPPGTGKTTVIAEIIWQTLLCEPRAKILITSQTNLAVDNALERLKGKKLVRPIRIGNVEKFEDEGKIYSNDRLKQWCKAKLNSDEEKNNADNAICEWIDSVSKKCSDNVIYQKVVTMWRKELNKKDFLIKETFSDKYFEYVNVFAATCSECGSKNFRDRYRAIFQESEKKEPEFDLVIMDEASKATPPELVLPLTLGKKVVVIGDHKQLPPMIDEQDFSEKLEAVGAKKLLEDWTNDDYKVSQFEKLFVNAPKNFTASLDTQFRMHEQIMNCISQFYKDQKELENGLICGIKNEMDIPNLSIKASRWHGIKKTPFIEPEIHAIWVNVETPEERIGTSYENKGEINAIQTVLRVLTKAEGFKDYSDSFKKEEDKEIGIITFYKPQMYKIRKTIYSTLTKDEWRNFEQHKYKNEFQISFRIDTVDRFQGMERNIIIISTVRSDKQIDLNGKEQENNLLGFAKEPQRINVGLSRAKRLLIVIGNDKHFSRKNEYKEVIKKMHNVDIKQLKNLALAI